MIPQPLLDLLSNVLLENGILNPEYNEGISDAAKIVREFNQSLYARGTSVTYVDDQVKLVGSMECTKVYGDYEKGYNKALGHVVEKLRNLGTEV